MINKLKRLYHLFIYMMRFPELRFFQLLQIYMVTHLEAQDYYLEDEKFANKLYFQNLVREDN